ncbi:MAG: prepilin peptidase [Planctomycetota bacterium]
MSADTIPVIVISVAVVIGAVSDYRGFRLPNSLTLPLVLSGIFWHFASGSADGLTCSLFGLFAACLPLLPAYAGGGMGAGDVKLMAGLGAWMGAIFALYVLIIAGLAGWTFHCLRRRFGPPELTAIAARRGSLPVETALLSPPHRQHLLPFGVMIAAGTLIMLALGGPV